MFPCVTVFVCVLFSCLVNQVLFSVEKWNKCCVLFLRGRRVLFCFHVVFICVRKTCCFLFCVFCCLVADVFCSVFRWKKCCFCLCVEDVLFSVLCVCCLVAGVLCCVFMYKKHRAVCHRCQKCRAVCVTGVRSAAVCVTGVRSAVLCVLQVSEVPC